MTLEQERTLSVDKFMSAPVITAAPDTSLIDAVKVMASKNIGNLVVFENDVVYGVLTEREILHFLALNKAIPDIPAKQVLGQKFLPIASGTSVINAAKIMIQNRARLLVFKQKPISGLDKLAGILTASDLMRAFLQTDRNPTIETTMSKNLITVKPTNSILYAAKTMLKKHIGCVIVAEKGNPLGLFSERDLMGVLLKKINLEEKIAKHASRPLVTANIGVGANQAGRIMIDNKIKRLPLKKGDRLVAIVTARDVVEAFQRRI